MRPSTVPRASKSTSPGAASASAHTNRAVLSGASPLARASGRSARTSRGRSGASSPPKRAEWTPGAPSSASISRPESSATTSRPGGRRVVERLLPRVLLERLAGLLRLRDRPGCRPARAPRSAGRPARRGFRAACRRWSSPAGARVTAGRRRPPAAARSAGGCPPAARSSSDSQRVAAERRGLGRALHLDEPAVAGLDDVHVDVGARVLLVGEVEQRLAVHDADAGGRDEVAAPGIVEIWFCARIFCSASTSATKPPVIDAVRVPPSAWMTSQSTQIVRSPSSSRRVTARSDRPISRWISCVRPPTLPADASRWFRVVVDARQHAVLGRHPALARVAPERRHAVLDARRADDARVAGLDRGPSPRRASRSAA